MKKNICIVTHAFVSNEAGQTLLSKVIKIVEPISNHIFVITGEFKDVFNDEKIDIIPINPHHHNILLLKIFRYILSQLKISFNLIKISNKIDVVIFYFGGAGLIFPIITSKIFKKKVIVIATASEARITKTRYKNHFFAGNIYHIVGIMERIGYTLVDHIGMAIKSQHLVQFIGLEKYNKKVITLNTYFIDSDFFKITKKLSERNNIVGYVGRLSNEKGVFEFVKAIPLIVSKKKDVRFLIVGDGPIREDIKGEVKKLGCLDKVDFIGWVPHEKIPDYLNEMMFHILPSHTEAFGGAGIEAMACGTISVANSVGGIPDIIMDNKTGFLLMNNSPKTIADKIIDILDYPISDLETMQQSAKAFVEENFCYAKTVECWEHFLSSLCKDKE